MKKYFLSRLQFSSFWFRSTVRLVFTAVKHEFQLNTTKTEIQLNLFTFTLAHRERKTHCRATSKVHLSNNFSLFATATT